MDKDAKQNIRLLLAAAFMHARISSDAAWSSNAATLRQQEARGAFLDADALLAEYEKTTS
jgi:hypothetical protein